MPVVVYGHKSPYMLVCIAGRYQKRPVVCACVMLAQGIDAGYATTRLLKSRLRERLPEYMVPRKFAYLETPPFNSNGKVDCKALAAEYGTAR